MTASQPLHVAICGAGLAGLGLALSLQSKGISCTVYEAAAKPTQVVKGSLNLAPNGQTVLDAYGLLPELAKKSCSYQSANVRNARGELISKMLAGHKDYFKYDGMRIIRAYLIESLVEAVRDCGIPVVCNKKFVRVTSESRNEGVKFEFEDGSTAAASLLIGADGIHSRVRTNMYPGTEPQYVGITAVVGSCDARLANVNFEEHTGMLFGNEIGTFLSFSHNHDNSEFLVCVQREQPDLGRPGWRELGEDKQALKEFLRKDYDKWPAFCQRELDNLKDESLFLWPMQILPTLPSVTSKEHRVLLIGDAAHAVPPTGGQGANQAFEDGYTLGLVLEEVQQGRKDLDSALDFWQGLRKQRIQNVLDLSMQMNKLRRAGENVVDAIGNLEMDDERLERMRGIYGGVPAQEAEIRTWAGKP